MKFVSYTWGDENMIFARTHIAGKDIVTYINGWWEWHCAGIFIIVKVDILTSELDFKFFQVHFIQC